MKDAVRVRLYESNISTGGAGNHHCDVKYAYCDGFYMTCTLFFTVCSIFMVSNERGHDAGGLQELLASVLYEIIT